MNNPCNQCGECCKWFVASQVRGLTPWQVDYMRKRCDKEDGGYFLIYAPCKYQVDNKCSIYETRPQICKDYIGKRYTNGHIYYIPSCCNMPTREEKDKSQGKTKDHV